MTSMPASRSARAMIFAPRSCPSRPGLATTTRILRPPPEERAAVWGLPSKATGESNAPCSPWAGVLCGSFPRQSAPLTGTAWNRNVTTRRPAAPKRAWAGGAREAARPGTGGRGGVRLLDDDLHPHLRRVDRADHGEGATLVELVREGAAGLVARLEVALRGGHVVVLGRAHPAPGDLLALLDRHLARGEEVVLDGDLLGGGERLRGEDAGDGQRGYGEQYEELLSHGQALSSEGLKRSDGVRRRILPPPLEHGSFRIGSENRL